MNFTDSNGGSYVALAATCGSAGIMNCLLEAGANPNIADEVSYTVSSLTAVRLYFSCVLFVGIYLTTIGPL